MTVDLRASGHHARFAATVRHGRVRLDHRLRGHQRHAHLGMVTYTYAGNSRVLPTRARLWAARRPARLKRRNALVHHGRLRVAGTISKHARGKVLVLLAWPTAAGGQRSWHARAPIRHGRWKLSRRLPAAPRRGGDLTTRYTGSRRVHVRGEQLAGAVRAR